MATSVSMYLSAQDAVSYRDLKDLLETEIASILDAEIRKAATEFRDLGKSSKRRPARLLRS